MTTAWRRRKADRSIRDWRTRLDAHITRCPGCDQWCWDDGCPDCNLTRKANS